VAVEKNTLKRSTFSVTKLAFSLISVESRKRALFSTVFLVFVGILDLMGVAIIGALGALSIQAIEIFINIYLQERELRNRIMFSIIILKMIELNSRIYNIT
jgi:hypothetical protein